MRVSQLPLNFREIFSRLSYAHGNSSPGIETRDSIDVFRGIEDSNSDRRFTNFLTAAPRSGTNGYCYSYAVRYSAIIVRLVEISILPVRISKADCYRMACSLGLHGSRRLNGDLYPVTGYFPGDINC